MKYVKLGVEDDSQICPKCGVEWGEHYGGQCNFMCCKGA